MTLFNLGIFSFLINPFSSFQVIHKQCKRQWNIQSLYKHRTDILQLWDYAETRHIQVLSTGEHTDLTLRHTYKATGTGQSQFEGNMDT